MLFFLPSFLKMFTCSVSDKQEETLVCWYTPLDKKVANSVLKLKSGNSHSLLLSLIVFSNDFTRKILCHYCITYIFYYQNMKKNEKNGGITC